MITLPEYLLSFKLSGLQQLSDGHLEVSKSMAHFQDWLDINARDVLDECDVSLAICMQLILPSGSRMSVDGHPIRWQVIQLLLHRTHDFITTVQAWFRNSVEIVNRVEDGFPLIYFLRKEAENHLIELLIPDICMGNFPFMPFTDFQAAIQGTFPATFHVALYAANWSASSPLFFNDRQQLMKPINLLRGLFVVRILISSLKKRWNVQFGLHASRAPIAVPHLAKGVPSVAAEWSHPVVAIVPTCLSFYYQGLSLNQFKQALEQ